MCISYQFTYLKIPRISTSRTEALTIGKVTSAGPSPTNTTQPPDSVALQQKSNSILSKLLIYYNDIDFNKKDRRKNQMYNLFSNALFLETFFIIIPVKIGHLSIIKLIDC